MKSIIRNSAPLIKPEDCDPRRELYIESVRPIRFRIQFYDEKAIEIWDSSPIASMSHLPWGYHWENINGQYGLYRIEYANDHEIELILYGPDEKKHINYNLMVDGNNYYTLAHTRNSSQFRLGKKDRKYPRPIMTNASGYKCGEVPYMPGHCVDHVDSIIPPAPIVSEYGSNCTSSFNPDNYIPEVQKDYWGLYMRKELVAYQRKEGLSYSQLVEYSDQPSLTASGAAVPESVYFYCLSKEYVPTKVSCINWSINYNQHKKPKNKHMYEHMDDFSTSLEAAPKPVVWNVRNSERTWRKYVRDNRLLGHKIRKDEVSSYDSGRDQIYAYGRASSLEYANCHSAISAALAASPERRVKFVKANLRRAVEHGRKLLDLGGGMPIDANRYSWVKRYHEEEKPGFEDDGLVDVVKRLSFS